MKILAAWRFQDQRTRRNEHAQGGAIHIKMNMHYY
jgi:hypothetical protein